MSKILNEANIKTKFFLPPWKRCLQKSVDNSQYTIALDASYSQEREEKYLLTRDYYHITPKIFYLKKNFPNGLPKFKSASNIFNLGTICGLFGYNYEGFSKGIDNEKINMDAKNFESLTQMVASNRCTAFIARYEIIAGFKNLGEDYFLNGSITTEEIPNANLDHFYMMISKKFKYAFELKGIIDAGISKLERQQELEKLLGKYMN